MSRLVVLGDVLLDRDVEGEVSRLTPDAPAVVLDEREVSSRPGGAGLAAVLAARDGHEVVLVTALPDDAVGAEVAELLTLAGVGVVDLGLSHPLGEKIRLRAGGTSLTRWDRGGHSSQEHVGSWSDAAATAVSAADAILVACYGRGVTAEPSVRAAIRRALRGCPVVWDPHPRGAPPVPGVNVATPNRSELGVLLGTAVDPSLSALSSAADQLHERWAVGNLVVTLGSRGALLTTGHGLPAVLPAQEVATADTCGAGDRFASRLAGGLADGEPVSEAVRHAVDAASAFVAAGAAGGLRIGSPVGDDAGTRPNEDAFALAARVRADGGTLVATGGCFDLLHAGHVQLLDAARALGDRLIVCLNGDASVRRLKGPGRPIVAEEERAELLLALSSVDAVAIFTEDTPGEILQQLRPHVFAKGGDYGAAEIPEATVVRAWGGQAVTLPYLHGRSTTRILEEVHRRER